MVSLLCGQTGDIIARAVLILLLIMSLASWYVMLTKLWDQRKLKQSARVVEKQFWTAPLNQGRGRPAEEGR